MGKHRFDPDPQALAILRKLRDAGFEAYFCGGCVRDSLMGRQPEDWDITTSATPEQIEAIFPRTLAVGKSFGVTIVIEEGKTTREELKSVMDLLQTTPVIGTVLNKSHERMVSRY